MTSQGAGISAAGPIWHQFIARTMENQPIEEFLPPDPIEVSKIMLDGSYVMEKDNPAETPIIIGSEEILNNTVKSEIIPPAVSKEIHSILYYVDKNNPRGEIPSNPSADLQFKNWEWAVQANNFINF